jgi:hypothetical protein
MVRGECLKILVDYDLFGTNAKDKIGIYLKTNQVTNKHLVYFLEIGEWGEFKDKEVKRTAPGKVSPANEELMSRIVTMKITY